FPLKPRFDDRWNVAIDPVNRQRTPVEHHDDSRLAGFMDRLYQLQLESGQVETGARFTLADKVGVLAKRNDDGVHLSRHCASLVEFGLFALVWRRWNDFAIRKTGVNKFAASRVLHVDAGT